MVSTLLNSALDVGQWSDSRPAVSRAPVPIRWEAVWDPE
jgi:hypothetical protein